MRQLLMWPILWKLRFWAKVALRLHQPIIIGIAGSVGKSSTRNAVAAILKDHFPTKVVQGNSETGIPLGLVGLEPTGYSLLHWIKYIWQMPFHLRYLHHTKYAVVEMGIDDPYPPKNMEYLLTILKPDIAISLNITGPHLGQFEKTLKGKTVENQYDYILDRMADEDTKIISQSDCKIGIYNADDQRIETRMHAFANKKTATQLLSFGKGKDNAISYAGYSLSAKKTTFDFTLGLNEKKETIHLSFAHLLLPREYQEVFAAAILVGLQVTLSFPQIRDSLEKNFTLPKGRSSILEGIHDTTLIDSSYNAPPKAVIAFLDMVEELKKQTKRPIVFLMGDMRELGEEARIEHERVAKHLIGIVDYLYCVGPLTQTYVLPEVDKEHHTFKEIRWFANARYAGDYLKDHLPEKSIVLVKGSQNTIFLEETIKYLLADTKDEEKLCRQEAFWSEIKKKSLN